MLHKRNSDENASFLYRTDLICVINMAKHFNKKRILISFFRAKNKKAYNVENFSKIHQFCQ